MLTARGDEVDRVLGLELGTDDYLPKPFSSRELVARIRAILRRTVATSATNATISNGVENNATTATGRTVHERLVVGDVEMDIGARGFSRRCGGRIDGDGVDDDGVQVIAIAAAAGGRCRDARGNFASSTR